MSRAGGGSGRKGRTVTPDEADLWDQLARTVDKVKAKPRVAGQSGGEAPVGAPPPAVQPAASEEKAGASVRKHAVPEPSRRGAEARRLPPLTTPDRRTNRQLASGKTSIEARLDLHGARQRDARARLVSFLRNAQANGYRTVLVITGKGGEVRDADPMAGALGEPQRGVLRRSVPQWLGDPDLRDVVLGFTSAGARHGGDGALYVQLRKLRDG